MSDETREALARRTEELAAFLTGEAPLEGAHFGGPAPEERRILHRPTFYWWRSAYLRPLVADLLALLREERELVYRDGPDADAVRAECVALIEASVEEAP